MSRPAGRIGVFDSGVGGLTVAAAIRRRLPEWPIVYLGDTARLPYGTKSASTVRRYTERNVRFLVERNVDVVVVACNSASALVVESASIEGLADSGTADGAHAIPVLGVIGPGARRAASIAKRTVGVVATEATVGSDAYPLALRRLRPELEVHSVACPLLVPLVEEGWFEDTVTKEVVTRYLQPLLEASVDTLILGCTHYPLLREVFAEVMGKDVTLVDSGESVSDAVAQALANATPEVVDELGIEAYVTDASPRFARIAESVLGTPVQLEWIDTP